MRRLAQSIVGALALALMLIAVPWDLKECLPPNCYSSDDASLAWLFFGVIIEVGFFSIILVGVLVGILGIRDSGRASEAAVLAALGRSRGAAVKIAAKRGAIDGAVATGMAFGITGAIQVALMVQAGVPVFSREYGLWFTRLGEAIVLTGALTLAHVIDALRPRRTPVERLYEDAAPPRPRRVSLRWRALALLVIIAGAAGILAGLGLAHDPAFGSAGTLPTLLAQGADLAIALSGLALFFLVGIPLIRMAIPPTVVGAAKVASGLRATQASALLRTRAATASGTSARTVLAIAGLALLAGLLCGADPNPAISPSYVGTVTVTPPSVADAAAGELRELDGVGAVIVGTQYGDYPSAVAVDPADVQGVDRALYELLRGYPSMGIVGGGFDTATFDDFATQGIDIHGVVPISTCCTTFTDATNVSGEPSGAALLVYAAPGADPAAVATAVDSHSFNQTGAEGWGSSLVYYSNGYTDPWGAVLVVALVVVLCLGPVIALAWGVAARRRRDEATLGALGASRRTLTGVAVAETTAIAAASVAGGLLSGAVLQTGFSLASRGSDSLQGLVTPSYLDVLLHSVTWAPILWIFVGAVAVFAGVAWIVGVVGGKRLPAEQLRAAEAGRV